MNRSILNQLLLIPVAALVLIWTLLPLYHMLVLSLTPTDAAFAGRLWPDNPTLKNYATVLTQGDYYLKYFWQQLGNSVFAAAMTCIIVLSVASFASFAIGRLKVRYGDIVSNVALMTYLIPAAFLAIPMYQVMATYELINTIWALILSVATFTTPYAIWVLRQYGDSVPFELDEAAKVDGATPLQIYRLVYIPLIRPALLAIATFALLHAWNEYLYAFLMLANESEMTMPVAMGLFLNNDDAPWPVLMAMGVIYSLPPATLYYAVRKYMVTGLTAGGVKS
ncbi:MAG: carbohydrate ABC transporter permease [Pseudomonadota bacterium]